MYYRRKERGEDVEFSPEEMSSCMKNEQPGTHHAVSIKNRLS